MGDPYVIPLNESSDTCSELDGLALNHFSYADSEVLHQQYNVIDDKEYLKRTFNLFPRFACNDKEIDDEIDEDEIRAHVLGAAMANADLLHTGLTAQDIDNNLQCMTNGFMSLKNIADILGDSDAAKKNREIALKNKLFESVLKITETPNGLRFSPIGTDLTKELIDELERCGRKNKAERERHEKRKREEMHIPENLERHMMARNLLVYIIWHVRLSKQCPKVKWQDVQSCYASMRDSKHSLYHDLYLVFKDDLNLESYPSLDAKANKYLFGRSKTSVFLSVAMFNKIISFEMNQNQLYVFLNKDITPENCKEFIYVEQDFDELTEQRKEREYEHNARDRYERKQRQDDYSSSNWKEGELPTATTLYTKRFVAKNTPENTFLSKNNDTAPFGKSLNENSSSSELSSDEDDVDVERHFSDEDDDTRRQKEEQKKKREKEIAEKERLKQEAKKRREQRLQSAAHLPAQSTEHKAFNSSPDKLQDVDDDLPEVCNQWERLDDSSQDQNQRKNKIIPIKVDQGPVQTLFKNESMVNKETQILKKVPQSSKKSLFGGPSQSRPGTSVEIRECSPDYISTKNVANPFEFHQSSYNMTSSRSSLDRSNSSLSINTLRTSLPPAGNLEERQKGFLSYLKILVFTNRSDTARHMRLMSNISCSCYGHPSLLFGSKYIEKIQEEIPEISAEDLKTAYGFDTIFNWNG